MQEPDVLEPSPKSKKKLSGSPSGSVLLQRSKVTVSGPWPVGGSGFVVSTANGGRLPLAGGSVVLVGVAGAGVVAVGFTTTGAVVVVALSSLPATATAAPAAAAPAPAMPMTPAVPMPPPTKPAGRAGKTATAALST